MSLDFVNFALDFNFAQIINQPTRGNNILDLLLTSDPDNVGEISCFEGFSDHKLIQLSINIPLKVAGKTTKVIRDYSKANYSCMNPDLEEFYHSTFLPSLSSRTVDENWSLFREEITLLVDKYVPEIAISNDKRNPWFNKYLRTLRNKKKAV